MSFILVPKVGSDIQTNSWNWRPTLLLVADAGILTDEEHERMGANGCGGYVDAEKTKRIAALIEAQLAKMKGGERMRADRTVTAQPLELLSEPNELYSASYDWLSRFHAFCLSSEGFEVV